jgi:hypothetical protein
MYENCMTRNPLAVVRGTTYFFMTAVVLFVFVLICFALSSAVLFKRHGDLVLMYLLDLSFLLCACVGEEVNTQIKGERHQHCVVVPHFLFSSFV